MDGMAALSICDLRFAIDLPPRSYHVSMEIRPLTVPDLRFLGDIDAVIESTQYLHLERSGDGVMVSMKVEARPLREKKIVANPIDDDLAMSYRQIAAGEDEGIALAAEHDGQLVAAALAQPQPGLCRSLRFGGTTAQRPDLVRSRPACPVAAQLTST